MAASFISSSERTVGVVEHGRAVPAAGSAAGGERTEEESEVGRTLRKTPHEVSVPVGPVGHVYAHPVALGREPPLLALPDAVEHLELVGVVFAAQPPRQLL